MKKLILLALLPLALAACQPAKGSNESEQNPSSTSEEISHHNHETHTHDDKENTDDQGNTQTEGDNTGTEGQGNTDIEEEDNTGSQDEGNTQTEGDNSGSQDEGNTQTEQEEQEEHHLSDGISLDDYKNYTFHEGREPEYNNDWDFYFGTTYEPSGSLWENPDYEYSGIEFKDKKQHLISPTFVSYPKVEVRLYFWFSAHTSNKYKATKNEPQFLLEEYDSADKLVATEKIEIQKSDIPTNHTPLKKTHYITTDNVTHFILRFNNFIPNGDSGYTAILCDATLKGWQYK